MAEATMSASSASAWSGKSLVDPTINPKLGQIVLNNNLGALHSVAGIDANQQAGRIVNVINRGASPLTLAASDSAAAAKDQFSQSMTIPAGGKVELYYNGLQWEPFTDAGVPALGAAVASAAAIVPTGEVFHVTGTTNITSITATNVKPGQRITIIFDGILTFTDGSNLKLAGNLVTTADDTITLVYDGVNFYEVGRSVN
jgi:hypothetical protein